MITTYIKKSCKFRLITMFALMTVSLISGLSPVFASNSIIPDNVVIQTIYKSGPGKPVGTIDNVQGRAVIMHTDARNGYIAQVGLPLYNGDTLFTEKKSRLIFTLQDGSRLTLSAGTQIEINKSVYNPSARSRLSFMRMMFGKARFAVKKMSEFKHSRFNVKTRSSVVGVRGSDFILEVSPEGDSTIVTTLADTVLELVDPANPLNDPVVITSFQQLEVVLGQVIGRPTDLIEEEIKEKLRGLGGGGHQSQQQPRGAGQTSAGGSQGFVPDGGTTQTPGGKDPGLRANTAGGPPLPPLRRQLLNNPAPPNGLPPRPRAMKQLPGMPGTPNGTVQQETGHVD